MSQNSNDIDVQTKSLYRIENIKRAINVSNAVIYISETFLSSSESKKDIYDRLKNISYLVIEVSYDTSSLQLHEQAIDRIHAGLSLMRNYLELAAMVYGLPRLYADILKKAIDDLNPRESFDTHKQARIQAILFDAEEYRMRPLRRTSGKTQRGSVSPLGNTLSPNGESVAGIRPEERKRAILDALRDKGQMAIKDITQQIKGVGEKTIQRDINELIDNGAIIRHGERRWSRYELKPSLPPVI